MARRLFWVLYDYGQGGLWGVIAADSAAQVRAIYPQLQVFDTPPPTLDDAARQRIIAAGSQDIADPPAGWLKELAQSTTVRTEHG